MTKSKFSFFPVFLVVILSTSVAYCKSRPPLATIVFTGSKLADPTQQISGLEAKIAVYKQGLEEKEKELSTIKREVARLDNVIVVKNRALDKAIAAIQMQDLKNSDLSGDVYTDPLLGQLTVRNGKVGESLSVIIGSNVEQVADIRFSGAIREKRQMGNNRVIYLLDKSKISLKGNN